MEDNFAVWKKHFIDQAKGLIPHQSQFYKVTTSAREEGSMEEGKKNVKIESPLKQMIVRAKNAPQTIYDPTTGVMRHSLGKPRSVQTSKKKRSVKKKSTKASKSKKKTPKKTKKKISKKKK